MKHKSNLFKKAAFLMIGIVLVSACESDEPIKEPVANFEFTVSMSNSLEVAFTSTSENATSVAWNFGDNTGTSTETNPTYTYTQGGTYTVTLTATNESGANSFSADVTVIDDEPLTNGSFDDATGWTIINHYEATNLYGSVTIADGVVKFEETTTDWKHLGIYTTVTLGEGTYQFDMEVAYTDINDVWGEAYIGTVAPVEGVDYGSDQGATEILTAYNAWDCPDSKTHSGLATESGCDEADVPGQFEIASAGTYYLLFRTGGAQYGTDGIIIDNMTLSKIN